MLEKIKRTIYKVAIYIRLSKEDIDKGYDESESITNQKALLTEYVEKLGWEYELVDIYIDPGYTGTNFNRPDFKRMIKDIELGKVNMVVTKDLSRLGRDYIETGEYIEKWFPENNVRYVSVTDKECMDALMELCRMEGIIPAIESAHALAHVFKMAQGEYKGKTIIMCLSGRGDKDVNTVQKYLNGEETNK